MAFINVLFFLIVTALLTPNFVLEYHNLSTKKEEKVYIKKYEKNKSISVQAYVVSLKIKQTKYVFLPWKKLKIFNREKNKLEALIKQHPNNIHLRYIRLIIQEKTPILLNYHSSIKTDKIFLKNKLQVQDSLDYLDYYIYKNTSL